jgi:hypothetical protein
LSKITQLILEKSEHHRLFAALSERGFALRFVRPSEDYDITTDLSVVLLDNITADSCHITGNPSLYSYVAANGENPFS